MPSDTLAAWALSRHLPLANLNQGTRCRVSELQRYRSHRVPGSLSINRRVGDDLSRFHADPLFDLFVWTLNPKYVVPAFVVLLRVDSCTPSGVGLVPVWWCHGVDGVRTFASAAAPRQLQLSCSVLRSFAFATVVVVVVIVAVLRTGGLPRACTVFLSRSRRQSCALSSPLRLQARQKDAAPMCTRVMSKTCLSLKPEKMATRTLRDIPFRVGACVGPERGGGGRRRCTWCFVRCRTRGVSVALFRHFLGH